MKHNIEAPGGVTAAEISQQPAVWPDTLERVRKNGAVVPGDARVVVAGAGTSAYASVAVEAGWPNARAIPTTDLLPDIDLLRNTDILLSLARSGNSPESVGVVETTRRVFPHIRHIAITCNAEGRLANHPAVEPLLLDPRTNDRSLVMTSSFSNLVLAGLAMRDGAALGKNVETIAERTRRALPALDAAAAELACEEPLRMVIL